MTWIRTEEDLPEVGTVVCGLWANQSMLCYRTSGNQWIDVWHNCYCYTAPKYYIYLPFEYYEKKAK